MLNLTRLHLGIAHESQFQGLGISRAHRRGRRRSKGDRDASLSSVYFACRQPRHVRRDASCKPVLSLRDVRISEPRNLQRTWSGVLVADASPCSTTNGPFEIEFTRLKETAPDLRFTERFTWASGRSEVSIDMWWDEWFEDYRIAHIAACPCRD